VRSVKIADCNDGNSRIFCLYNDGGVGDGDEGVWLVPT